MSTPPPENALVKYVPLDTTLYGEPLTNTALLALLFWSSYFAAHKKRVQADEKERREILRSVRR